MNPRMRSALFAAIVLALVLLGWVAIQVARNSSATAGRIEEFVKARDLKGRPGSERADLLRRLEGMVNGLSMDERRKWWEGGAWRKWFEEMTDIEKGQYIDATMPTGFKHMLTDFEDLPDSRRKVFIDETMKKLRDEHRVVTDREPGRDTSMYGTNDPPVLSPELERRARTIGLKTLYTQSSAETKAELAPFLEELQHQMERGKISFQ